MARRALRGLMAILLAVGIGLAGVAWKAYGDVAKKQIAKRAAARDERGSDRTVATNRRARREYDFIETLEAGIVLQGSEVKSLREGKAQLSEAKNWP